MIREHGMEKPKAILFDLDGTLVDSAPDLAAALNTTMGILDHNKVDLDDVKAWIGNGVDKLVQRALDTVMDSKDLKNSESDDNFWRAKTVFYSQYEKQSGNLSKLYSNVIGTLEELKRSKIHLACITNKSRCFTLPLLDKLGIRKYFDVVVCGDDLTNKKPHPEPLLHAANKLSVLPDQCLMIGDSSSDVKAANAANMPILCVDYGYNQGIDLNTFKIDGMISDLTEVPKFKGLDQKYKKCG